MDGMGLKYCFFHYFIVYYRTPKSTCWTDDRLLPRQRGESTLFFITHKSFIFILLINYIRLFPCSYCDFLRDDEVTSVS